MTDRLLRELIRPFDPFLADPNAVEIVVVRPGEFGVEANGAWTWHAASELDYDACEAIGILSAFQTSQDLSPVKPLVTSALPDGQRIHICRPPATAPGIISINVRRPSEFAPTMAVLSDTGMFERERPETLSTMAAVIGDDLASQVLETVGLSLMDKLIDAAHRRMNIVVAGRTNTGKTTLALALIGEILLSERLITIEDTPEWRRIRHRNRVGLFYSKGDQGTAQVKAEDLLEASLRMRPDRVLMGELRDGAAWTYLRALAAGHPGGITTLHANSAKGAFEALGLMMRQHPDGKTMPDSVIERRLHEHIDLVVHLDRNETTKRISVTDIYERPR